MSHPPLPPAPPQAPPRPPSWFPDPLDDSLLRYWDGYRWTFHTAARPVPAPSAPPPQQQAVQPSPVPAMRRDIVVALQNVRGVLVGSMKEVNLLPGYLRPEEQVLALTAAQGEGQGVLACTNRRLLFLFVGVVRRQFLEVDWNQTKHIFYSQATKTFSVYTTKFTKRAIPAFTVRVNNLNDANTIAHAAQSAAAAPRLDVV
ncbi:hypothetical protein DMH01_15630 [Amycolatopsis sp. WAC 04182]|uniref:DUF2510 domain-containing protein n=1 Tax=Amycolatopsis sp. WAC 04182 TaxID=2203198 RepID=UPI000F79DD0E|nr:DUF2510 domain-containing protein [Amycolatopsis sp. WAC 04182]RSN60708.1 hypothetical protein DMH01_15630 [Amycolatopsis sp. WAC 04182]